ncbi:putative cytochrome P450 oxidoreductase [Xylaria bambusicola]|uniref:putative cytochrome P450 oxidoreductase n=1 Tax=Xylaria bambusicola TaxID=326684 RepID=UPI0020079013|nr:putative cytochrome P450 oxidoreductase [Xylaria bambusicola]KAI0515470.1 putative cytochrome P450 oxidoreductase [Xylaria bambusicola]
MFFILVAIGAFIFLLGQHQIKRGKKTLPLPPGPPGQPLIGHLRVIPVEHPEFQYSRWAKEYNTEILHFNVLGRSIIILDSIEAAHDLLDKRGANYADRPRFVLFEVMGWGVTLTFLRWSRRFLLHRKLLQSSFTQSACKAYQPIQIDEARRAARAIINDPNNWQAHLRQFSTAVILRIGFGIEIQDKDDPYIKMTLDVEEATGQGGVPAGNIVDFFPMLRYLPTSASRISKLFRPLAHARRTRQYIQQLHDAPWESVEPSIRNGEQKPSFVHTHFGQYLANEETGNLNEATIEDLKGMAGAIAIAGGNTTWSTIIVCILGLLINPDALAKARAEMEDVIGVDKNGELLRLPTFEDRSRLKYLANVLHETTRWQPLSPLGVPHATLADDEYKGYHIPAGSVVYPNVRAMSRDKRHYSFPEEFRPERYEPTAQGGKGEPTPEGPFGFGRRRCPGEHLAMSGVWIMISTLIATMHIDCPTDADGKKIKPKVQFSDGLSGVPDTFGCRITPRSLRSQQLLLTSSQT